MPQNKFEVLRSRIMQYGVEKRTVRSMRTIVVRCFKCREEGNKCRECLLWERRLKRVAHPKEGKVHQEERRPVHLKRGKAQEQREKREVRRVKEEKAACSVKGEAQQE